MGRKVFWGIVLVFIGLLIWLGNMGYFIFRWHRDWPLLLVIFGIYILIKGIQPSERPAIKKDASKIIEKVEKGEMSVDEAVEKIKE